MTAELEPLMKITGAHVWDPRAASCYKDPILRVRVNRPVYEQGNPIWNFKRELQHRLVPCGPFFALEFRHDNGVSYGSWVDSSERGDANIGKVNTAGLIKHQLIEVAVETPDEVLDLYMMVPRARRMLRRYEQCAPYEMIVDEEAALQGDLKWRVELSNPVCYGGATIGSAHCRKPPIQTIVYRSTHLTLCADHLADHAQRMRANRTRT